MGIFLRSVNELAEVDEWSVGCVLLLFVVVDVVPEGMRRREEAAEGSGAAFGVAELSAMILVLDRTFRTPFIGVSDVLVGVEEDLPRLASLTRSRQAETSE